MEPDSPQQLFWLFAILSMATFFSVCETALTSLSKIRLRNMEEEGVRGALQITKLVENPKKMITAVLIGNTFATISAAAFVTTIIIRMSYSSNVAIGIAIAILTLVVLIFCEITPKIVASQRSEQISLLVYAPLKAFIWLFSPIIIVLNCIIGIFVKFFGCDSDRSASLITEAELKTLVNVSHEEGVLEGDEKTMINNVFEFGESRAKDVMTPRIDLIAIRHDATYEEVKTKFYEENFSRMPVYKENTDDIVGVLYFKDFVFSTEKDEDFNIDQCMRKPYFTYESKPTKELFSIMRLQRIQVAVVLDEYGGTSGIITLEDLIEEIVGEIEDEFDEFENEIEVIKEDEYIVDGSTKISDFNDMVGTNLESDDYESIGGFVIGVLGKIPNGGEVVQYGTIKFIIEEIDKNRIEKLRIYT